MNFHGENKHSTELHMYRQKIYSDIYCKESNFFYIFAEMLCKF